MTELINSLKTLAYGGGGSYSIADRRSSTGQLRIIPLLNLGRNDSSNDSSFTQWRDAMRMVARLPGGLPPEFRLRLWENLSDRYLQDHGISWAKIMTKCRIINSRDVEIADQIEKDLHRTGCTGFEGGKQAVLKRVLVSYARWNPSVGYCQGFNMIGAMLLQMTSGDEKLTLKVLIYLIEGVLPQGYFSQGLRGLAVDMAVFREILRLRKHTLHNHLSYLQNGDENPPLTDVFTMHWFLTLFIHCLPTNMVLRIWDLVLLEGSEVLIRTALVLWTAIEPRILAVSSADEFYSVMGVVTREMLEYGLMDPNALVKCIVSVGPFPFPGLVDLRQQQRAIIQQDTPYKSFFLAKRELDNLKRHYAAMKDRQKATTIILKGLEASRVRVPGQRSNSLFVAPTIKKQMVSCPKPKARRASSSGKGNLGNNMTNINTPNGNLNIISNNIRNNLTNGNQSSVGAPSGMTKTSKQVTMTWDKAAPKIRSKNFRRRRTASASSHTDSSSSTELCDSNSSLDDSSDSEGVWSETDGRWKKPKGKKKSDSPGSVSLKSNKSNLSLCPPPKDGESDLSQIDNPIVVTGESISVSEGEKNFKNNLDEKNHHRNDESLPPLQPPSEDKSPNSLSYEEEQPSPEETYFGNRHSLGEIVPGKMGGMSEQRDDDDDDGPGNNGNGTPKILDTNDSQHFLEEISRLGKSDSFYENLSKRICELQFQNLRILNSCNTTIDPKSLILPQLDKSPLPSPMTSHSPTNFDNASVKLTPIPTPKILLSQHSSISSISDLQGQTSPSIPKSPVSPAVDSPVPGSRRSSYSKRTSSQKSSQSITSVDIPDICVDAPGKSMGLSIKEENGRRADFPIHSQSSEEIADSVSHFMMTLKKTSSQDYTSTTEFETDVETKDGCEVERKESKGQNRNSIGLTLDLSSCNTLANIKPFTPLKTPDFLQLSSFTDSTDEVVVNGAHSGNGDDTKADSNPTKLEDYFGGIEPSLGKSGKSSPRKICKVDVRNCLVSPVISSELTSVNAKGRSPMSPPKDIGIPPRPKNFPVSPAAPEDFLLAAYGSTEPGLCMHGNERANVKNDYDLDDPCVSPVFPTTACPCQCQTTEEINAVIRQNIAILNRLKLKPAYELTEDGTGEDGTTQIDEEYEDLDYEEGSSSDYSTGFPELSNFKEDDSSDRDSGLPTCSSKNSLTRKDSSTSEKCGGGSGKRSGLKHQDSSGCSSGSTTTTHQQITVVRTDSTTQTRRRSISGGNAMGEKPRKKSLTRTSSVNSSSSGQTSTGPTGASSSKGKQKKNFNPFPTARRARVRTTKFGLYN